MNVMDISKTDKAALMAEAELNAVEAEFEERTPEIVAAEIRQIADQTRKMVLNSSIEIGKRLCEAKEMIPHGEWGNWLEHSVNFKQSTANNLMKIYTEYGDIQGQLWGASAKSQTFGNLSYSQAVALLAVPAEEREEFVKENHVEDMSTRELQEAIKARDEALAAVEKAEKKEKKLQKDLDFANKKLKMEQEDHEKMQKAAEDAANETQAKIEELREKLAAAEAKEPEPSEDMQAEIDRLKAQLKKAELLGAERLAADEETARFKVLFQTVQNNFSDLMDDMACIRNDGIHEKGRVAIRKLLLRLLEEINENE